MLNPFYLDKICVIITNVEGRIKKKRIFVSEKNETQRDSNSQPENVHRLQVASVTAELIIKTDEKCYNDESNSK